MPFNGSGTFNRLYNWTQDASNGIKIRADRMDAEDNGFATGLTNCLTRDGQSPWNAVQPANGYGINNAGPIGVGMVGINPVDITKNLNGVSRAQILNGSAGAAAVAQWSAYNGGAIVNFGICGTAYTAAGMLGPNVAFINASSPIAIFTSNASIISLGVNNAEAIRIDAVNNFNMDTPAFCNWVGAGFGLTVAGSAIVSNFLQVNGSSQINGAFTVTGGAGITAPNLTLNGGPSLITMGGFGRTTTIGYNGTISTNDGNGIQVVCVSNGVVLNNGTTSWAAISAREAKKNIQSIPGDVFERCLQLNGYLYHYLKDDDDRALHPGLMYDESVEAFPWATHYVAAHVQTNEHTDPDTGEVVKTDLEVPEFKGLSLEQHVPLLVEVCKRLIKELETANQRIATLEGVVHP